MQIVQRLKKRSTIGILGALAIAGAIGAVSPNLEYRIYNWLEPKSSDAKAQKFSQDEKVNIFLTDFVEFLEAENDSNTARGIDAHYREFVRDAKLMKVYETSQLVGAKVVNSTPGEENASFENLGFVYVGEMVVDSRNEVVVNSTFGRIVEKRSMKCSVDDEIT